MVYTCVIILHQSSTTCNRYWLQVDVTHHWIDQPISMLDLPICMIWNLFDTYSNADLLVGGLEHFLFFHSVGNFIIPTDELIFFRGVETTNQFTRFLKPLVQPQPPRWRPEQRGDAYEATTGRSSRGSWSDQHWSCMHTFKRVINQVYKSDKQHWKCK